VRRDLTTRSIILEMRDRFEIVSKCVMSFHVLLLMRFFRPSIGILGEVFHTIENVLCHHVLLTMSAYFIVLIVKQ